MKQLTLPFRWNVWISKDPNDVNPVFASKIEAVSPKQAVRRSTFERKIRRYDMESSLQLTAPSKNP